VIAVGLMLAGIALLGVVTATLASWLIERVSAENATNRAATAAQVDPLMSEIRALRGPVADVRPGLEGTQGLEEGQGGP
jgi:voltage-gated potassium channel